MKKVLFIKNNRLSNTFTSPETALSKEQKMLQILFNQKNQLWGKGEIVKINRYLQTGHSIIKMDKNLETQKLFW